MAPTKTKAGPKGPRGPKGPKGERGPQGPAAKSADPEAVLADRPILTAGSGGAAALELIELLHASGYETSAAVGDNPFGIVDASVLTAVKKFRSAEGIKPDLEPFQGDEAAAANHIVPADWLALVKAAE